MARTPEAAVKAAVKDVLKEMGIWYWMPVQNGMGQVGIHDFVCCARGRFLTIETKAPLPEKSKQSPEDKMTPNQKRVMAEIKAHGGVSLVIATSDKVVIRTTLRLMLGAAIPL